jgi:putative sigma-54 modulation protein
MAINFTGRQVEISPALQSYTEARFRKIVRLVGERYDLHVILTAEKHRRLAELPLKFRQHQIVGIEETGDIRTAISGAIEKLGRQAVRQLDRGRTRKRRHKPTSGVVLNVLGMGAPELNEHRIVHSEHVPLKPMTVEEAVDALDRSHAGAVVFRNPQSERVNVIYHRPDGHLGLIEPEP